MSQFQLPPTPKRYNGRSRSTGSDHFNNADIYSENRTPIRSGVDNYGYVPPKVKMTSEKFNELLEDNRKLFDIVRRKNNDIKYLQDELQKCDTLVKIMQQKLKKYKTLYTEEKNRVVDLEKIINTENTKKKNIDHSSSIESSTDEGPSFEIANDFIQIPKKQNNVQTNDNTSNDLKASNREMIIELKDMVNQLHRAILDEKKIEPKRHVSNDTASSSSNNIFNSIRSDNIPNNIDTNKMMTQNPTEEDIITKESEELIALEKQVNSLCRKLKIRDANDARRRSLHQQIRTLSDTLYRRNESPQSIDEAPKNNLNDINGIELSKSNPKSNISSLNLSNNSSQNFDLHSSPLSSQSHFHTSNPNLTPDIPDFSTPRI
ncbi:hypothetical protein TBLA_0F03930 [Henningerozyma blattae CBS 6284]|uniref:Spindle pole body component SPC42 n=1 Tax=Henningerozyma blattae (strain ATCC 34711 / CBS 6284 / DSM 70876 / NBRC 10599 / NRRL Y-10934 / UCD 77-7) TaxID=1071380 RepID=I2H6C5_HENB6|nr:hypothetical protein TBLA_0F03930 [Tetrapisispora blattae CBS 6284]CCH61927.1 hypothetical protein TBLA_0F03930 [Tetrapisispora blattae CBS 6284]